MIRRLTRWHATLIAVFTCLTLVLTNCATQTTTTTSPSPTASSSAASTAALVFGLGGQPANLEPGDITDNNPIYLHYRKFWV